MAASPAAGALRKLWQLCLLLLLLAPDGRAVAATQQQPPVTLFDLHPTSGPTRGGTVVALSGAHIMPLAVDPICKFGLGGLLVRGTAHGRSSHAVVTCPTPAADSGYEVIATLLRTQLMSLSQLQCRCLPDRWRWS
jgi:hypothetical protein